MPADGKPGANAGKAAIDWGQAFLYYAGLPPEQRSYQAVADQYRVSVRTVERHGRNSAWRQQARALDRDVLATGAERIRDVRVEKLADVEKLIDATHLSYANQLRDGKVRVTPADLPRLHALRTELWNETDVHPDEQTTPASPADPLDPTERKLSVLRALNDAGVLARLLDPTDDAARAQHHNEESENIGRESDEAAGADSGDLDAGAAA